MATKKRGRPAAPKSTVSIYVRLPRELRAWLQDQAVAQDRTLGQVVVRAVREYRDRDGAA
jgi:hypothetical protein